MALRLHFEPNLEYQHEAIESVCDLFRGQEICKTEFTVTFAKEQDALGLVQNQLGIGNRLSLLDDEIHTNLTDIQIRNGLKPSEAIVSGDFTVEMETGTGKTYVYLRTIFELNRRYGFTKFCIVVPSVAIKEGVFKSIQMMEDHFRSLYANVPFDFFIYDSGKLGQVRNFATSPNIQIMIVTVGAINKKDVNNLYKDSEKTGGEKPIDLIKATQPILIVDEPQSVDGGLEGRGKEALDSMSPLCTLRYSATHVSKHHMVYSLNAVDAYEKKLVKQIEVASASVEGGQNKPFVKLLEVSKPGKPIRAKLELDMQDGASIKRKATWVQSGDDLEQMTGRGIYAGYLIGNIGVKPGNEFLELSNLDDSLKLGKAIGGVDEDAIKRQMIHRTIEEHLDKELRLAPQGIKVLSLFFVDSVEHYRQYAPDGSRIKGKYAVMFEEEYKALTAKPKYKSLFSEVDSRSTPEEVHDGYFSIDKKKIGDKTVEEFTDTRGNSKADEDTYSLIMKDKEKLLSFESKLKFIFSHSALKEGWDNPNVFQICALRDMGTERERRQTIGRGLRLCVDQTGERKRGFETNTLTVIATESYEDFAANLQKEIEEDTGIRFGVVEGHQFAGVGVVGPDGSVHPLGMKDSQAIWDYLKASGHIDAKGKVQDSLKKALKDGTFKLPDQYSAQQPQVAEILKKLSGKLEVKNADERKPVKTRQAILDSEEFKALWDRIKHKTTYRVEFDNEKLIKDCIEAIKAFPKIPKTRLKWRKADLSIGKAGVEATETETSAPIVLEDRIELPDVITDLQDKTQLTRATIVRLLLESGRLDDFKANPQAFIDLVTEIISKKKRMALVDGIKYQRLGDEFYYAQSLFESEELTGYLKNMLSVQKSVHEYVVYDSPYVERGFAEDLEKNPAVKVYAKLPGWFKVPTPLGTYNPDWAVLIDKDGEERLYFVVETKSSLFTDDLRDIESAKIKCGEAHFKALKQGDRPAEFVVATTLDDVFAQVK
jgi:type III restriction enzyme